MSNELKEKVREGMFWVVFSNALTIGCQLLSIAVLARLLSPQDFGLQAIGLLLLDIFVVFTYPFINKAIVLRKVIDKGFLTSATMLSIVLSIIMAALFFASASLLAVFFNDERVNYVIYVISIIFIIRGIYQPYNSLFEKDLRFRQISNYNLAAFVVGYLLVPLMLAQNGLGFKALILGLLSYEIILMTLFLIGSKVQWGLMKREHIKELFADSGSLIAQMMGNRVATNGDLFVISKFLGTESLGYYSRAYKIMKMPTTIIGNVINNLSFASLTKVNDDDEKLRKAFIYSSFLLALVSFPIFITTWVFTEEIILILLGDQWLATAPVLKILALGIFLRMSYKVPGTILKVKQKFSITARIQIIYAFNIIVFSLLLLKYDIEGVAVATLAALILQYAQMIYEVNKSVTVGAKAFISILVKPMLFAGSYSIVMYLISLLLPLLFLNSIMVFIGSASLSALIHGAIILKYGPVLFGESYSWWLSFLIKKKKNKK